MHESRFNTDAYITALVPPRFDIGGGRVLTGRILSADEWFRHEDQLMLAASDKLTRDGLRTLMITLTDLMFDSVTIGPWPFRRTRPASRYLLDLPYRGQLEAFQSFTLAQAEAQKGTTLRAMVAEVTSGTISAR